MRGHREQGLTRVELKVFCDKGWRTDSEETRWGSGVIVDERHVLTAYHVVECPDIPFVRTDFDGERMMMVVVKKDIKADIALLELASANDFNLGVPPPVISAVAPGELVCSVRAFPKPGWSCGLVETVGDPGEGNIGFAAEVIAGNSGSALYNERGELVGIVVGRVACPDDSKKDCSGTATGLFGRFDYYPK